MIAIWKHMENPCYKIMFYVGILDMLCMLVNAISTGWLGMTGAVYCSAPNYIYIAGALGLGRSPAVDYKYKLSMVKCMNIWLNIMVKCINIVVI
jgi:hypothetical protein